MQHHVRVDAGDAEAEEAGARAQPELGGLLLGRDQHGGGAVDDLRRVPRCDDALRDERRLERRHLLERRLADRLVDREPRARQRRGAAAVAAGSGTSTSTGRSPSRSVPRRARAPRAHATRTSTGPAPRARASTPSRSPRPRSPASRCRSDPCTSSDIEPRFEPIGTRDIISTPPETTRSSWPDHTAAAALKFVCIDEPHCRSTVVPQTDHRPAGGERDVPADVPGLLVDLRHAAPLEVLDLRRDRRRFGSTSPFTTWAESSSPRMCEACRSSCRSGSGRRRRSPLRSLAWSTGT